MIYSCWKLGQHNNIAIFELFYRKNPFDSGYAIFAGLERCLKLIKQFKFTPQEIEYIRRVVLPPSVNSDFFLYLESFSCKENVDIWSVEEGSIVSPYLPLVTVRAPYCVGQVIESVLINSVDYPSLVATNSSRYRLLVGKSKLISEFGLRRAPGIEAAVIASKYAYIGGADNTSNLLAGYMYGIPVSGTISHSFISSFTGCDLVDVKGILTIQQCESYLASVTTILGKNNYSNNRGELIAFISYANSFPDSFMGLLDTYDTINSGFVNFAAVSLALHEHGYKSRGVRIDSGDLAYLANEIRTMLIKIGTFYSIDWFKSIAIMVSNQLNIQVVQSLLSQSSEIDGFGIGSGLVGCNGCQTMGCVYKLVEINGVPCSKVFQADTKGVFPFHKKIYRIYESSGAPMVDYITKFDENCPVPGEEVLCYHLTDPFKRMIAVPTRVKPLQKLYFSNGSITEDMPSIEEIRQHVLDELSVARSDHLRLMNSTPYKVSFSERLIVGTRKYLSDMMVIRQFK